MHVNLVPAKTNKFMATMQIDERIGENGLKRERANKNGKAVLFFNVHDSF